MKRIFRNLLSIASITILSASMAHAQSTRTWVSGTGEDSNAGTRIAPCQTIAGAMAKTAVGGEIDAIDPGGYGTVTITEALTIDGGGGQVASILASGADGIVVNAGSADTVVIRNLRINGMGSGLNGINFVSGKYLILENCYIDNFTINGVDMNVTSAAKLVMTNCHISRCSNNGINIAGTGGAINASITGCTITGCSDGVSTNTGETTVSSSQFNYDGLALYTAGGIITSTKNVLTGNGTAVRSNIHSTVVLNDTQMFNNTTYGIFPGDGQVISAGNNLNYNNGTNGTPTTTIGLQ